MRLRPRPAAAAKGLLLFASDWAQGHILAEVCDRDHASLLLSVAGYYGAADKLKTVISRDMVSRLMVQVRFQESSWEMWLGIYEPTNEMTPPSFSGPEAPM